MGWDAGLFCDASLLSSIFTSRPSFGRSFEVLFGFGDTRHERLGGGLVERK